MINKVKKNLMSPNEYVYLKFRKRPILKQTILLESTHGREVSGHIFVLAEELRQNFPGYQIYVAVRKNVVVHEELQPFVVEHMSREYLRLLAGSEYLINDTSFWSFFHKRKEQKYFIFWHGTPLKYLGKAAQVQGYGNVQRNLAAADQIFVSNEFTKERLQQDFGIQNITHNELVVAPSPRNSLLFTERVVKGRYLYVPTWRGVDVADVQLSEQLLNELAELDRLLSDQEEMYVKLHPYEAQLLRFEEQTYRHLKLFPADEELYSFLQTVEKLVTDYSSVMFDFAVTNRPVILFAFDEETYRRERGMYLDLAQLPFTKVTQAAAVIEALRTTARTEYHQLQQTYTAFDEQQGASIVLNYLLKAVAHPSIKRYSNWNGKENVLIYAYQLSDNGITSSLLNLMNAIDLTQRNYILIWQEGMIPQALEYKIKGLPQQMYTFIQTGKMQCTLYEMLQTTLYMNQLPAQKAPIAQMYRRDFDRLFPNLAVDHFIHYPGYDRSYAVWTWALQELGVTTSIFVHTDMEQEFKINPALKPKIIYEAYRKADHVVCVSQSLVQKIRQLVPQAKTMVMEVLINETAVREIAETPLEQTKLPKRLLKDFEDPSTTVFLSVGRFSKQKGYDRLIEAFERLNNRQTRLVLICSYGPEKQAIEGQINQSPLKDCIYLFDHLVRPYHLVKAADAFVFSSRYEGLGMVVFEALAVETPVIMTEIPETLEILADPKKAIVVENSTTGLTAGMQKFLDYGFGKVKFDFMSHTQRSLAAWERLFRKN